jgi:hypothetical protein
MLIMSVAVSPYASAGEGEATSNPNETSAYLFLRGGGFSGSEFGSFGDTEFGYGLSLGGGFLFRRHFAFEVELDWLGRDYAVPVQWVNAEEHELSLETCAGLANLRAVHSIWRLEPSVGIGLGIGLTELNLASASAWNETYLEGEFTLLSQVSFGLDFRITKQALLGFEYRKLYALSTFDWLGQDVDPGGETVFLSFRIKF